MYNFIFLLPLYNDWESLSILLNKISEKMLEEKKTVEILIVNDFSKIKPKNFKKYKNINKIRILNLKENLGSQKAISVGLNYLNQNKQNSIITILDSDGEDDVNKIPIMIEEAEKNEDKVIVSTRTKRQENIFFKLSYFLHKVLLLLFTLKWISYGNFSSFSSKQLKNILRNDSSWLAISSCIAKNCEVIKIKAERKKRLIGKSKLSAMGLIYHSLRVNAVFNSRALVISFLYSIILLTFYFQNYKWPIFILILIVIYNVLLAIVFKINKQKDFACSANLIDEII